MLLGRRQFIGILMGGAGVGRVAARSAVSSPDPETGISVRFIRSSDPIQPRWINRYDVTYVTYGFGVLYPECQTAVRIVR